MGAPSSMKSTFPIPSSLQELESHPYNLIPYPHDFDDDDEASRAESFDRLIRLLENGNRSLMSCGMGLFEVDEGEEEGEYDVWNDGDRVQALYTLVRFVHFSSFSLANLAIMRFSLVSPIPKNLLMITIIIMLSLDTENQTPSLQPPDLALWKPSATP